MLPRTSILKYNLWRSLNHPVAYQCLLKPGLICYKVQQVDAFVKTLTESDKEYTQYPAFFLPMDSTAGLMIAETEEALGYKKHIRLWIRDLRF